MTKQSLFIYKLPILFNILYEIKENLNFDLYNIKEIEIQNIDHSVYGNYLILTNFEIKKINLQNQVILNDLPIRINNLIEKVNIKFHKKKFSQHSKINIGEYILDISSRTISKKEKLLKLTEREVDIILFLFNSKKSQNVNILQQKVWGHNSSLETHTVETHIYRLRKKMSEMFMTDKFIISSKDGYKIL